MHPTICLGWFYRALLVLVMIYLGVPVDPVIAQDTPQVIILNSYHQGFAWSDAEEEGFIERLSEVYPTIDVPIEYLDAKRYPDQDHLARMKDFLIDKYQGKKLDLVVTLDNPALEMLTGYRNDLFPDSPIVFAGVSNFNPSMLAGRQRVTGVAEKQDLRDTLRIALALHPHTEEVLVVDDYTSSGLTSRQEMEALIPSLEERVRIRFLPPVTFDEARAEIGSLSPGQLVLIHSFSTDRLGQNLSLAESTRFLTADARVPVYAGHETRLGHGIIGGYLLGGRDHGRQVADMALRILAGEDPNTMPITNSTARPMFDYVQLERFGLSAADLPADSIIINKPESIFETYREVIIGALSVVVLLVVVVIFLIVAIIRRRQAEKTLKESEERLRLALEGTTDGIWDWNLKTGQVYFSPRYYTMLGYEPGEFAGTYESWRQLLHPDDAQAAEEVLQRAMQSHTPYATEFRVRTKNGEWCWTLGRGKVVEVDQAGQAVRMAGSHTDITGRKQTEAALRLSVTQVQTIINNAPLILFSLDQNGIFTFSDGQALKGMGLKPGEVVGQSAFDVYHDRPDILSYIRRAITGEFFTVQTAIAGHTYDIYHSPLLGENGQNLGAIGILVDVTERQQAEEALREKTEELDRFFTVALDLLCIADTDGYFRRLNPQWEVVLGYSLSELQQQRFIDLVHPDDQADTLAAIGALRTQKLVLNFVNRYRCKDGSYRWIEWRSYPAEHLIYAAAHDITERRWVEEEIRKLNQELEQRVAERTAQLEAANRDLEAFSYSVSHDLRAPLRAIDGYTRILEEDYEAVLDAEGQRVCAVIRQQTQRMGELIDNLLTFSRLGRAPMKVAPIDMAALVTSIFQELTTPKSQARIDFQVGPLPPALGDPAMVRQVWFNLLANAIKFSARCERAVISVDGSQADGAILYSVRDNGAGFDMQYAAKLFGVFQRLHSEREFQGTGVGLAIVQRIIHRHGGRVWAEGVVDQGAVFYFTLPRKGDQP